MILYEIISNISAMVAGLSLGAVTIQCLETRALRKQMDKDKSSFHDELNRMTRIVQDKVQEFSEVTEAASKANVSHAEKIVEIDNTVQAINERVSILSGNATVKGADSWKKPHHQRF